MQTTIPAEDSFPSRPVRSIYTSPLARAALENGVTYEDVQAYCTASQMTDDWHARWYEACNVPSVAPATPALDAHVRDMITDTKLEGALVRSVLAKGVEHARLWWLGVL